LIAEFPAVRDAAAKLERVRSAAADGRARVDRLVAEESDARSAESELTDQARRLLDGQPVHSRWPSAELMHARQALRVADRAVQLAAVAHEKAVEAASEQVCAALKGRHRQMIRQMARLVGEAHELARQEAEMHARLHNGGVRVSYYLEPLSFGPIAYCGPQYQHATPIGVWRGALERTGVLKAGEDIAKIAPAKVEQAAEVDDADEPPVAPRAFPRLAAFGARA
jgi:gluconate kinase